MTTTSLNQMSRLRRILIHPDGLRHRNWIRSRIGRRQPAYSGIPTNSIEIEIAILTAGSLVAGERRGGACQMRLVVQRGDRVRALRGVRQLWRRNGGFARGSRWGGDLSEREASVSFH